VAARSAGEQAQVLRLAGTAAVWTAGFSASPTCAAAGTCVWRWDGYGAAVNFTAAYLAGSIASADWQTRGQEVLLNNYIDGQHWAYAKPDGPKHAFICRKEACGPGQAVSVRGVCDAVTGTGNGSELAWVAGPVLGGLALLLLVTALLLWRFNNAAFNRVAAAVACGPCRPAAVLKLRVRELEEENERLRSQLGQPRRITDPAAGVAGLLPLVRPPAGVAGLPAIKPTRISGSSNGGSPMLNGNGPMPNGGGFKAPTAMPLSTPRMASNRIAPAGDSAV